MKTAEHWEREFKRGLHTLEHVITRIQADALGAAAEICLKVAESPSHHDATDCARAIIAEAEKLNP